MYAGIVPVSVSVGAETRGFSQPDTKNINPLHDKELKTISKV